MSFTTPLRDDRPVINISPALDRLGGDVSLLRDMAVFFLEDIPPLVDNLQRGLAEQDADLVVLSAHSIKGLSRNFDAVHADQTAQLIEDSGRKQDFETVRAEFLQLREQLDMVVEALKTDVLQ